MKLDGCLWKRIYADVARISIAEKESVKKIIQKISLKHTPRVGLSKWKRTRATITTRFDESRAYAHANGGLYSRILES